MDKIDQIMKKFRSFVKKIEDAKKEIINIEDGVKDYDLTISHLNPDKVVEDTLMKERLEKRKEELISKKPELIRELKLMTGDFEISDEEKASKTIRQLQEGTIHGEQNKAIREIAAIRMKIEEEARQRKLELARLKIDIQEMNPDKDIMGLYKKNDELEKEIKDLEGKIKYCEANIEELKSINIKNITSYDDLSVEARTEINSLKVVKEKDEEGKEKEEDKPSEKKGNRRTGQQGKEETSDREDESVNKRGSEDYSGDEKDDIEEQQYKRESVKMVYYNEKENYYQFTHSGSDGEFRDPLGFIDRRRTKKEIKQYCKDNGIKRRAARRIDPNIAKYLLENDETSLREYLDALKDKRDPKFIIQYDLAIPDESYRNPLNRFLIRLDAYKAQRYNVAEVEDMRLLAEENPIKEEDNIDREVLEEAGGFKVVKVNVSEKEALDAAEKSTQESKEVEEAQK